MHQRPHPNGTVLLHVMGMHNHSVIGSHFVHLRAGPSCVDLFPGPGNLRNDSVEIGFEVADFIAAIDALNNGVALGFKLLVQTHNLEITSEAEAR